MLDDIDEGVVVVDDTKVADVEGVVEDNIDTAVGMGEVVDEGWGKVADTIDGEIEGEPVSDTIVLILMEEVGTKMLEGSGDVIELAALVNAESETTFVVVMVTVSVPIVPAIASETPEHMLVTVVALIKLSLGQLESRHRSAASPSVNPEGVL